MNATMKPMELEEVLAQCEQEIQQHGRPNLKEWLIQYPQYADEIIEYCSFSWDFEEAQKRSPDPRIEADLRKAAQDAFLEATRFPFGPKLGYWADRLGMSTKDLADKLGIGMSVLAKLDRRLIRPETIPQTLVDRLATVLRRPVEWIRQYLEQPPVWAHNASYRAFGEPGIGGYRQGQEFAADAVSEAGDREPSAALSSRPQQAFHDAIRSASDMTSKQKAQWVPPT